MKLSSEVIFSTIESDDRDYGRIIKIIHSNYCMRKSLTSEQIPMNIGTTICSRLDSSGLASKLFLGGAAVVLLLFRQSSCIGKTSKFCNLDDL